MSEHDNYGAYLAIRKWYKIMYIYIVCIADIISKLTLEFILAYFAWQPFGENASIVQTFRHRMVAKTYYITDI